MLILKWLYVALKETATLLTDKSMYANTVEEPHITQQRHRHCLDHVREFNHKHRSLQEQMRHSSTIRHH